jgi:hypothetical protein
MSASFSVTVSRSDLSSALKQIIKVVKVKNSDEAVLSCEGSTLLIGFPGGEVSIPCKGSSPGRIHLPLQRLVPLGTSLPDCDPFPISVEGDRVLVGTMQFGCTFEAEAGPAIELPLDPPLWTLLALKLDYSEEDIQRHGLSKKVGEAESRRDELIEKAARTLAPLGVGSRRLREFIDETVRWKNHP